MDTMQAEAGLRLRSIDDYLGPGPARFFGGGYRRVGYTVTNVANVDHAGSGASLQTTAGVSYPADWSKKTADVYVRPHVSTIDTLILGVRAALFCLGQAYGLDLRSLHGASLRRVDIRAGLEPYEDGLDQFPVVASLRGTVPGTEAGRHRSTLECGVANMKIRCEIEHALRPADVGSEPGRLTFAEVNSYGEEFRHQAHAIENLSIDAEGLRAGAEITVDGTAPPGPPSFVAYVNSFVVSLQMGQVLLYELDGIRRADSNTLWMRRTTMTAEPEALASAGTSGVVAALEEPRLLTAGAERWRTATIVGDCQGVLTRCAVAHRLPPGGAEGRDRP